jgi:mRNA interferase MazF
MSQGDIVLIPFPFTDLTGNKVRPAVVLINTSTDVTLAFITTQLHWQEPTDVVLAPTAMNGLKKPSLIRLSKIAIIDASLLLGRLGILDATELTTLKHNLRLLLQL